MSLEEQNEIKHVPHSSDKSPLLRTFSIPEGILYRNGEYVKNKNAFLVNHASSANCTRPSSSSSSRYKDFRNERESTNYLNKIFLYDCKNEQEDIAAMSVGSLYQSAEDLESDLDTDK